NIVPLRQFRLCCSWQWAATSDPRHYNCRFLYLLLPTQFGLLYYSNRQIMPPETEFPLPWPVLVSAGHFPCQHVRLPDGFLPLALIVDNIDTLFQSFAADTLVVREPPMLLEIHPNLQISPQ